MQETYDLIILGAGPAGLSAAVYSIRFGLNIKIIARDMGMMSEASEVENYLGIFPTSGMALAEKFQKHAADLGANIDYEDADSITKDKKTNIFTVKTRIGNEIKEYNAKAVIYALGGAKRKLGLANEQKFRGKGISYCATCDAAFFKNKIVAVTGGNNSSLDAALHLSKFANKVYVIYRQEKLRADESLVKKAKDTKNIEYVLGTDITELKGDKKLEAIAIKDSNSKTKELKVDGVFVEFGYEPNTDLAESLGIMLEEKRIKVSQDMSTNVPGFFAAGDCTNGSNKFDQIITAAGEGAVASQAARKYILLSKK